jgi:hypothetical protein
MSKARKGLEGLELALERILPFDRESFVEAVEKTQGQSRFLVRSKSACRHQEGVRHLHCARLPDA